MRWRVRAAFAVLVVTFLYSLFALAVNTARVPVQPRELPDMDQLEAAVKRECRHLDLPARGVVAYRDEVFGHPGLVYRANTYFFYLQYALTPLLLDPDWPHDVTLVRTKDGLRVERRRGGTP